MHESAPLCGIFTQGSTFSARLEKSAPDRSNKIIIEISVKLVGKYFAYGVGAPTPVGVKNGLKSAPEAFARSEPCHRSCTQYEHP